MVPHSSLLLMSIGIERIISRENVHVAIVDIAVADESNVFDPIAPIALFQRNRILRVTHVGLVRSRLDVGRTAPVRLALLPV